MADAAEVLPEEEMNPLNMSDDEVDALMAREEVADPEPKEEESTEEKAEAAVEPDADNASDEEEADDEEHSEAEADEKEEGDEESESESESDNDTAEPESKDTSDSDGDTTEPSDPAVNFEAEYNKILKPFRANGKDIKVDNVDEAITLMQMGVNYTTKMAGLKPSLKIVKMLENNDLLDEAKLTFLIDLDKKNPDAVAKFMKDSGINPLDIDVEAETAYKPNTYTVNDKEVELDTILSDMEGKDGYSDTIDLISNKWDDSSKRDILNEPAVIDVLRGHVVSGIFKQIDSVVQKERALGKFVGVSDLHAYKQVGDAIQARNGFAQQAPPPELETPAAKVVAKKIDPKLKSRKKAASSTKTSPKQADVNKEFNPLSMSDEDFDKLALDKYL